MTYAHDTPITFDGLAPSPSMAIPSDDPRNSLTGRLALAAYAMQHAPTTHQGNRMGIVAMHVRTFDRNNGNGFIA